MNNRPTILISGAFNPLHLGHLLLLKHASSYGEVIVALNSDMWIKKNKGYLLFNYAVREMLLRDCPYVSDVVSFDDSDGTVCDAIRKVKPTFFGNGGTIRNNSIPEDEYKLCMEMDIVTIFGLGENEDDVEEKYLVLTQDSILRHSINELDKLDKFREIHQQQ